MANIGEPQRVIISEPLVEPIPREVPFERPESTPVPEREPEKVPAGLQKWASVSWLQCIASSSASRS